MSRRPSVASAILAAPPRLGRTRLVAIDGPSGSGKSVFAATLRDELGATLVSTDDFATWDDPVSWWPRLVDGVLAPIAAGRPGRYRKTEWTDGRPHPGAHVDVDVPDVLLVEVCPPVAARCAPDLSYLIWCEYPDPVARLARAVARDGAASRAPLAELAGVRVRLVRRGRHESSR